jgi:hypothetical protein
LRRKDKKKEEERKQQMIEEGIKLGHLTKDGYPTCIVCGAQAGECSPVTGLSWMDKVPLLNRLFALPPRYVIVDAFGRGYEFCKIHKDVATAKLEEFHGLLRAERGRFNALQAEQVARMDGGGLVLEVQKYHKSVVSYLQETISDTNKVRHLLPAASQSDHTAVSTLSSKLDDDPLNFSDVS